MTSVRRTIAAAACAAVVAAGVVVSAQFDPDRVIPGGGMRVPGWTGKIDASSVRQGRQLSDAKLVQVLRIVSQPHARVVREQGDPLRVGHLA